MHENVEWNKNAYSTGEIATMLDMGVTTVRKYAQHLEKAGYEFQKTKNNARMFVDNDIDKIRHLKELRENPNITVQQATKIVMGKMKDKKTQNIIALPNTTSRLIKDEKVISKEILEMKELIVKQNETIISLIERLDQQQTIINEWLNERDKELMRAITERLETQRLIAATTEETTNKKSFMGKLFGK
ncbi:MerR family transcriptional regulator [Oceanobacillus sp. Castelsardo]|uniref:MerR family transcriptional regulator n=1 Tax=Oceanobacillus sp. Castelsardo TaxID=1851204 RepID=UPI000839A1B6|nr:MerR family transcriptional regulator [Oceanobacillus sp. Castelsardo]